jgi:uncharacterized membrane protein
MMKKYYALAVILAMALPGLMAAMPVTQGTPWDDVTGSDLLAEDWGAGAIGSDSAHIHMKVQTFDPLEDDVELPRELLTMSFDGLYLIQFTGVTMPQWEELVEAMGCQLLFYVPDNGFIARMTKEARNSVVDLPFVRWVGPYHPGFRVLPELWANPSPLIGVAVITVDDVEQTALSMLRRGALLESVGTELVQGLIPRSAILGLARDPHVSWIEPWAEPELHNDNSARLVGSRQLVDEEYDNRTLRMWSYNNGTFEGLTGEGYIVSAADTGLDDDHPSFAGHLPTINYLGGSTTDDTYGHGTHVMGTIAGSGIPYPADSALGTDKYIGVAPGAKEFMQDMFEGFNLYRNWDHLGKDAYAYGAVVSSNSWGSPVRGAYDSSARAYDVLVRDTDPALEDRQELTFAFSAGNSGGGGDRTIASPASAKNVITVGATGNDKRGVSSNNVAGFSSRGPAADGRVKPDVVASGAHVVSAQAWPHTMPFNPPPEGGTSWTFASGTSMSCPAVAGAVAMVHQWSEVNWDNHTPSPAMVKALLVNGADKLSTDSTYPGTKQGWGRVNLTKLHETPNYRTFFYDQELPMRVGGKDKHRHIFAVEEGQRFVRFTVTWTDYPGTAGASKALVSDLDLVVRDPDGNVYKGNNFDNRGYSLEGADLTNDSVNNVERVVVPQAKAGFWSVEIMARNTPAGAQTYALVAQGDLRDQWRDLVVQNATLSKAEVDEGEALTFSGDIVAMGTLPFEPFDFEVFVLEKTTQTKHVFEEGTITGWGPWMSRHFQHTWTAVRGDYDFVVEIDTGAKIKEFTEANNIANLSLFVKGYGLVAELIPSQVTVWPGLEAHLDVNVQNQGNVWDTFVLSTEGIPVGWKVSLDTEDITLGVGGTGTITMKVEPPPSAKAMDIKMMHVDITSQGNSTYSQKLEHQATVGQIHGLNTDLAEEQRSVFPGFPVVHVINITNTGNGEDIYNMTVLGVPPGWESTFTHDSVTIEDNVTTIVRLELQTPETALLNTIADLDIVVTPSKGKTSILNARTRVRQSTGLWAELTAVDHVRPGGRAGFQLYVENRGNGLDVFTVTELRPNGWRSTFAIDELVMDAFENYTGLGDLICPKNARAGINTFTIQVASNEWYQELTVEIEVEEVYDISKVLQTSASAIYPGNETTYLLDVTSLCNLPTDFTFSVDGAPLDWVLDIETETVTIDPSKAKIFRVVVRPPETAPSGLYDLSIVLEYGPEIAYENVTIYIIEKLSTTDNGGTSDGGGIPVWVLGAIVLIVLVMAIVLLVVLRRRGGAAGAAELPFEMEDEEAPVRSRPLPPPPPPRATTRRPLPPPPPSHRPPETVDELLADTVVMERVSTQADSYSADKAYASGQTLASQGKPTYAGDCPKCGGQVLEYPTGVLMCGRCGTQYTDE